VCLFEEYRQSSSGPYCKYESTDLRMADPSGHAKVWVYCRSIAGIAGSNPSGVSLVSVVYGQVEVSAKGISHVERSSTECGVSECHAGTSYRGRRPTMAVKSRQEKRP